MMIQYFSGTDTLYLEFRRHLVAESHDLDEHTIVDLDAHGRICAITVENASVRADVPRFSY